MNIMLFLMNYPGNIQVFAPLIKTLKAAKANVTLVNYWTVDTFPLEELAGIDVNYLTISDGGFESIPRLSYRQYIELCGDDIDFIRCQSHNYILEKYPFSKRWLYRDSIYYQRYYGMAYRVENIIKSCSPDYIIVHQCSEPLSKIIYAKGLKLKIPTLATESSFFHDRFLLDSIGMHFFAGHNQIDYDWQHIQNSKLSEPQKASLEKCLSQWKTKEQSKYDQKTSDSELKLLQSIIKGYKKILFFPGQVPWDANIITSLGIFRSYNDVLEFIQRNTPDDWLVLHKVHPKNHKNDIQLGRVAKNFFVFSDISIHKLLQICNAVFVISSNVGFEALAYDKPVICAGSPYYSGKGLTYDMETKDDFRKYLNAAIDFHIDSEKKKRFQHYILFEYLIQQGDFSSLLVRLKSAKKQIISNDDKRAPFCSNYPEEVDSYVKIVNEYNLLADKNFSHQEISEKLRLQIPPIFEKQLSTFCDYSEESLHSKERQVVHNIQSVTADYLLRYSFAKQFVGFGQNILDFACGVGYGSYLLADNAEVNVTGVDCSHQTIEFANQTWKTPNIKYVCASAGLFECPNESFDLVVSFETVEHMPNAGAYIQKIWKLVKYGGLLIMSTPDLNFYPLTDNQFHIEHYSKTRIEELVSSLSNLDFCKILGQSVNKENNISKIILEGQERFLITILKKKGGKSSKEIEDEINALLPFSSLYVPSRQPKTIKYMPIEFSTVCGHKTPDCIVTDFAGITQSNNCFLYGPYALLENGSYTASFLLKLDGEQNQGSGTLTLEVVNACNQFYARKILQAQDLNKLLNQDIVKIDMFFEHTLVKEKVEFRIYIDEIPFRGTMRFYGLVLCRDDMANGNMKLTSK